MTLGRYNFACSNLGRGQITSRSPADLKVILDATPGEIGKRTLKHVNQRRQAIIYAIQSDETIRNAPRSEQEKSTPYV